MVEKHKSLENFVEEKRAEGKYSFTQNELLDSFDISGKALQQALYRLKTKNKIAHVRKGFYAIISPEFLKWGIPPPYLFIDDLMKSIGKDYYVGLFSAASLHGASHQAVMKFYVITEKPALRNISKDNLNVDFYVKQNWSKDDIVLKKTDAGYIKVSSPELTALDLLYYGNYGVNRAFTVIEELTEEMNTKSLIRVAENFPNISTIQRLGYLLDIELNNQKLANALKKVLKNKRIYPVRLSKNSSKNGAYNSIWNIYINTEIESDL
ncbi:MAG: type IV toxin-antitoxin system AbiEi family antitoxin [Chitinophagales bacterium]